MKPIAEILPTYQRQIHLDFHTSPYIDDVGSEFDADEFARTFKRAHVNSVTIFAKCHHGMSYYPTKVGTQHPALKGRDLLGEQIEALHRHGIRCPIYTTVAWEEEVAQKFPEWRQMDSSGRFCQVRSSANNKDVQPGGWKFNNFVNPDYQDYIESHVREILEGYDVDGLLFDILFFDGDACWSDASVKFRKRHGLLGTDIGTQMRFQSTAQSEFTTRFTQLIHEFNPNASIFYNQQNFTYVDSRLGVRSWLDNQTHFEIESLPSGFWGYQHFPRLARQVVTWDKPWIAITGRFQKMWGDFGGIKPQAALEYECFRTQALGGANLVGDQLPPRGMLDAAAYSLIGRVYAQCEAAEPFYAGSVGLPQIGILLAAAPDIDYGTSATSEEGAVLMCEEAHYEAVVLDDSSQFAGLDALLLPDTTIVTDALLPKLRKYYENGGKLLLSYKSGFGSDGKWALDFLPLEFEGEVEKYPNYWRATEQFSPELHRSDRVFYQQGVQVKSTGCEILVERVLPYFKRSDLRFCSHFQSPPVVNSDVYPAVVAGSGFVYFADPIFQEYRKTGNLAARDVWKLSIERLAGKPVFGHGLPTSVLSCARRRGNDLVLTLLHYIPVRKALDIDVIEERMSFAGLTLQVPATVDSMRVFGSGEALKRTAAGFELPIACGRLLLEAPDYFA